MVQFALIVYGHFLELTIMNNQSNSSSIVTADSSIALVGESKIARQRYVVRTTSADVVSASFNLTGKIGKEIRRGAIEAGRNEIAIGVGNGNFRPLAQFLALQFGESVYLRNQVDFFALSNRLQTFVDSARSGKNLGMTVNKKTGEEKIGARLADALELQSFVAELIQSTKDAIAIRQSEKESEITKIAEEAVL